MKKLIDLTNKRYGRILVLYRDVSSRWICRCDCGTIKSIHAKHLRSKSKRRAVSCGCYAKENNSKVNTTHGMSKTEEFIIWDGIISRCTNINHPAYKHYGGRGITICDRWKDSFENFYLDMGQKPFKETSIDRIDNDGNYEPSNCRWATPKEQARNRNSNKIKNIEEANYIRKLYKEGKHTQKEIANIYECSVGNISSIINNRSWI